MSGLIRYTSEDGRSRIRLRADGLLPIKTRSNDA